MTKGKREKHVSKMTAIESQLLGDNLSNQKKKRKRKRDLSRMASSLVVGKPMQEFEMPTIVEGMSNIPLTV